MELWCTYDLPTCKFYIKGHKQTKLFYDVVDTPRKLVYPPISSLNYSTSQFYEKRKAKTTNPTSNSKHGIVIISWGVNIRYVILSNSFLMTKSPKGRPKTMSLPRYQNMVPKLYATKGANFRHGSRIKIKEALTTWAYLIYLTHLYGESKDCKISFLIGT